MCEMFKICIIWVILEMSNFFTILEILKNFWKFANAGKLGKCKASRWKINIRPLDFFLCVPIVKSIAPDHFFGPHGLPPRPGRDLEPRTANLEPYTSNKPRIKLIKTFGTANAEPQTPNRKPRTPNLKPRTPNLEPRTVYPK